MYCFSLLCQTPGNPVAAMGAAATEMYRRHTTWTAFWECQADFHYFVSLYHSTTWPRLQVGFHQSIFPAPYYFLSFWHSNDSNTRPFGVVLQLPNVLFIFFPCISFFPFFPPCFLCSDWTIFIHQPWGLWSLSPAISILLRPSNEIFISEFSVLKFPCSSLCPLFLFWDFLSFHLFLSPFLVGEVL